MLEEIDINQFYDNYRKKIYRYAYSLVKDVYLAEDLTQEVFIKVYYNRHLFKRNSSLDTWIYTITKNQCLDYLRSSQAKKVFPFEEFVLITIDEQTPERNLIARFDIETLREKVELLPVIYKEVISLYYFNNNSLKEIQNKLNINISTVKTRLLRAKQKLMILCRKEFHVI